jgi:hypothetical protein
LSEAGKKKKRERKEFVPSDGVLEMVVRKRDSGLTDWCVFCHCRTHYREEIGERKMVGCVFERKKNAQK